MPSGTKAWSREWLTSQESRIRGSRAVIGIVTVATYDSCVLGTALSALNCSFDSNSVNRYCYYQPPFIGEET